MPFILTGFTIVNNRAVEAHNYIYMNTNEILPSVSSRYRGDKGTAPIEYSEQGVNIRESDSREIYETRIKPPSAKPKQLMSATLSTYPKQDRKARSYGKSLELPKPWQCWLAVFNELYIHYDEALKSSIIGMLLTGLMKVVPWE